MTLNNKSIAIGFITGIIVAGIIFWMIFIYQPTFMDAMPDISHPETGKEHNNEECFGWSSSEYFSPPSTEWYNGNCENWENWEYSYPNYSIQSSCNCYESKKSKLLPWEWMP